MWESLFPRLGSFQRSDQQRCTIDKQRCTSDVRVPSSDVRVTYEQRCTSRVTSSDVQVTYEQRCTSRVASSDVQSTSSDVYSTSSDVQQCWYSREVIQHTPMIFSPHHLHSSSPSTNSFMTIRRTQRSLSLPIMSKSIPRTRSCTRQRLTGTLMTRWTKIYFSFCYLLLSYFTTQKINYINTMKAAAIFNINQNK